MLTAERTWRQRYLRRTGVTSLTFYLEWKVQVAHQEDVSGSWWPLAAPSPESMYAGTRWITLGYLEKVRS